MCKLKSAIILKNKIFMPDYTKTIYQSGDWQLVKVEAGNTEDK